MVSNNRHDDCMQFQESGESVSIPVVSSITKEYIIDNTESISTKQSGRHVMDLKRRGTIDCRYLNPHLSGCGCDICMNQWFLCTR